MADKNHGYAIKMLRYHGFLTRSDVTARFIGHDQAADIGRADIFCAKSGLAVNVEVKYAQVRFALSNWRENQREWAAWTKQEPFNVPYYIFLTMGIHPPHYNTRSYSPRRSWLIPYGKMLSVCEYASAFQKSLPFRVGKGMNKQVQKLRIDAVTLFDGYELEWQKAGSLEKPSWYKTSGTHYGGFWIVPLSHAFYAKFIAQCDQGILSSEQMLP